MVKFRLGFTISAETLFALMSKVLPIDDLSVEEIAPTPKHNIAQQVKRLGADSLMPPPAKQRKKQVNRRGLNLKEGINGVILAHMADGQSYRETDLRPLLKAAGFSENSVSSRLQALLDHGVVKRVGHGQWRLTDPVISIAKEAAKRA